MAFHEDLRNHRLKKGLILEEISEDTKINVRILQALEQGDYHILPVSYIRLFLKAYALAIDYPVEDILRGLENELKLTGEQGIPANMATDLSPAVDMSGATVSNAHNNILQASKGSQNNAMRLIIGIAVLLIVIIFGKTLLKPNTSNMQSYKKPVLPEMNLSQSLDSMMIADSELMAGDNSLKITSLDFLSIIVHSGSTSRDTILQSPGEDYSLVLTDSLELKLYPSEAALLSIQQDTLPGSPFSNAWLILAMDSTGAHLRTYPTL